MMWLHHNGFYLAGHRAYVRLALDFLLITAPNFRGDYKME